MQTENSSRPGSASSGAANAWSEIEGLIREIAQLSRTDLAPSEFYPALLDRTVRGLAAAGGAVWKLVGQPLASCQIRLDDCLPQDPQSRRQHQELLATCRGQASARLIPPQSSAGETAVNPSPYSVLLGPVILGDELAAVLEVFQRPGASPAAQQGYLQFLAAACELATEYERNRELQSLQDKAAVWGLFEDFMLRLLGSHDRSSLAFAVVNEGRRLVPCDRLSLAVCSRKVWRVAAVSGLDSLDRRANAIRHLERLAEVVTPDEPLWFEGDASQLAPPVQSALETYLPDSKARMVAVVPLTASRPADGLEKGRLESVGALIIERFDTARADETLRQRASAVGRQIAAALQNVLEVENIPLYRVLRNMSVLTAPFRARHISKTALVLGLLLVVGLALWLVPAEFTVESAGDLQPVIRREVFAPDDGIVNELTVKPTQIVERGEVMAVLQSSKLDYEFARVLGEQQIAVTNLAKINTARLTPGETDANKLAAEQAELEVQLKSLKEQKRLLEKQKAELKVLSPIAGQVLTWDPSQELTDRPVQRGDRLFTVADLHSGWLLEMRVPDHAIGHVHAAQRASKEPLPVSFLLASDPGTTFHGVVEKVASATEVHETDGPTVLVTVRVTDDPRSAFRPGARVIPKIHCGRQPLGYVWLHDLIDAVRTRVLF